MKIEPSDDLRSIDPKLLSILLENPFLSHPEDEIGETALVKWITKEYKSQTGTTINKQDIYGLITKLMLEGALLGKRYGQRLLLKPTRNYYLLKNGQPMVRKKRAKTQVSLFTDDGSYLVVSDSVVSQENKTDTTSKSLDDERSQCHAPIQDNQSYYSLLLEKISHYSGPDKELVKYFPSFFNLACNILNDKYTDWHTKILISSALGYFVLEEDVIQDSTEYGYLDDLYILCYVLREIERHVSPSLLEDNWEYSEDVHELIEKVYRDTYTVIQDYACEILHRVGLRKFKELELEEYSGTYPHKIAKLAQEKRELMALTAYLIKMIYNSKIDGRSFKKIKDFLLQYGDYTEIARLIELSNRDYAIEETANTSVESFKADLERQLQQARLKALLDDPDTE
ncbi:YkvA family protein [Methanoculleus sp.]|jgi:uncharacterized membrane protein YkvA (DUF1232 family)|uniref:YkvA family protein n=1 Tax=Methanoculleus sp. TaxID=90427 RepID=UPI001BD49034|nr:DUF1232 domain-containing protein [Methanoculleus sp.]